MRGPSSHEMAVSRDVTPSGSQIELTRLPEHSRGPAAAAAAAAGERRAVAAGAAAPAARHPQALGSWRAAAARAKHAKGPGNGGAAQHAADAHQLP